MCNRDYDRELQDISTHKYVYNFDFDIMHDYMIRTFLPFFIDGNVLELGSFKGDFTLRLSQYFNDITCIEASSEAIETARQRVGSTVQINHATFEQAELSQQYDNIVMTHVLEHVDDPVFILSKIRDKWLAPTGRLFLVCPNAHAPSRQIAVQMGLVEHTMAVTAAELAHGHRRTYNLETFEQDAVQAGLKVIYRSGIFFKAFANFQWDKILAAQDIVTPAFLDGCYVLGQKYPDLCASIVLVCERGF